MKSACASSNQPAKRHNPAEYVFFCSHKVDSYGYIENMVVNEACFSNWFFQPYRAFRVGHDPMVFLCAEQEMMYRKALVFYDDEVAVEIMAKQLPDEVVQVLLGGLSTQNCSRTRADELYKESVASTKALGHKVGQSPGAKRFDDALWDLYKYELVLDAVRSKFTDGIYEGRTRTLADFLTSTASLEIVEAAHYDKVWGVGFSVDEVEEKVCVCDEHGKSLTVIRAKPGIIVGGKKAVAEARNAPDDLPQDFVFGETSGPDSWPEGSNLLGRILMQVRKELRQ